MNMHLPRQSPFPTPTNTAPTELLAATVEPMDRRKHRRFTVTRAGKVFRRNLQQFIAGESKDVSFSGALIDVLTERPVMVGEIVDVALPMNKDAVIPKAALVQGIVVRVTQPDMGKQRIAVRYIPTGLAGMPVAQAA